MSFATYVRNRNAERFIALLSAIAVLMSLMAIYAAPANAHHPTTTASVVCVGPDVAIQYTSRSWQNGSGHPDVRIEVSVNNGDWTQVASGAYTSDNNYQFSGTFDAEPYVGQSIRVRSQVNGNWPNGSATGNNHSAATTSSFTVVDDCDPGDQPVNVTVNGAVCDVVQGVPSGSVAITIDPASGATVNVYGDAAHTNLVGSRTTSGTITNLAPGTYYWAATAASGYELAGSGSGQFVIEDCTPPPPPSGWACVDGDVVFIEDATDFEGNLYESEQEAMNDPDCTPPPPPSGWACVDGDVVFIEDATDFEGNLYQSEQEAMNDPDCIEDEVLASIVVTVASNCMVNDGLGQGEITVTVSVDGGATVTVTDESGAVVGTFTSDGTLAVPEGASYTWVAVPSDGFEFPQGFEATGTVTIDTCTPTTPPDEVAASIRVTVSGSCELDGDEGEGLVDITLSVPNGATVVVRDSDGDVVGTVTDDTTLSVPEGATYTWVATPGEGFEFPSGFASSGSITIERCSDPESLPFTGFDPMGMGLFAILLVGAGITAINKAPREEDI